MEIIVEVSKDLSTFANSLADGFAKIMGTISEFPM